MHTVSVFSSQANLPLSDINRQDNKTLRAQFRIIFSNQRLISCQFAFTLPRMWRFYHHAVKESQAGTTGALISYTYCLHEMVCTYTDSAKMVGHFHKGHLEDPPSPKEQNESFHWFLVLEVIQHKKFTSNATFALTPHLVFMHFAYFRTLSWISQITVVACVQFNISQEQSLLWKELSRISRKPDIFNYNYYNYIYSAHLISLSLIRICPVYD